MRCDIMTVSFAALCLATPLAAQTGAQPVPGPHASDAALEGRVRAALARELGPALDGLTVEVRNGGVTLGGSVADATTRRRAERTAAGVTGVSRVSAAGVGLRAGR
ncbi:MAG: BON domain-containing protein [Gemmatimonadales bacterium]